MIENFASLEDVFYDADFMALVQEIKPTKIVRIDPELEKFEEILMFIKQHHREPVPTTLVERRLYSRLKGIRNNPEKVLKYKPYDTLNILGDINGEL